MTDHTHALKGHICTIIPSCPTHHTTMVNFFKPGQLYPSRSSLGSPIILYAYILLHDSPLCHLNAKLVDDSGQLLTYHKMLSLLFIYIYGFVCHLLFYFQMCHILLDNLGSTTLGLPRSIKLPSFILLINCLRSPLYDRCNLCCLQLVPI